MMTKTLNLTDLRTQNAFAKPANQTRFGLNPLTTNSTPQADQFSLRFGAAEPPDKLPAATPGTFRDMDEEEALHILRGLFTEAHPQLVVQLREVDPTSEDGDPIMPADSEPTHEQMSTALTTCTNEGLNIGDSRLTLDTNHTLEILEALKILTKANKIQWTLKANIAKALIIRENPSTAQTPDIDFELEGLEALHIYPNYGSDEHAPHYSIVDVAFNDDMTELVEAIRAQAGQRHLDPFIKQVSHSRTAYLKSTTRFIICQS